MYITYTLDQCFNWKKQKTKTKQTYVRLNAALMSKPWGAPASEKQDQHLTASAFTVIHHISGSVSGPYHVQPGQSCSCRTCLWMTPHICSLLQSWLWQRWCASQRCESAATFSRKYYHQSNRTFSRFYILQHQHQTLVLRSNDSLSCRCFPDLLARSIHFPLNHLTVGFFSNDVALTLATNVMFPPEWKVIGNLPSLKSYSFFFSWLAC